MAESRDPKELADLWTGWRRIAPPMRARYVRFVDLTNKGARELGFADTGAMWRSNYDMPPDQFSAEVERLWQQVRPFYVSLHAYVRRRLPRATATRWCRRTADSRAPAREHLGTGVGQHLRSRAPPASRPGYDLTERLRRRRWTRERWCARERASSRLSASPRCRRRSGSVRSSPSRRSRRRLPRQRVDDRQPRRRAPEDVHRDRTRMTSTPCTTSWGTTSTSSRTGSSRSCS